MLEKEGRIMRVIKIFLIAVGFIGIAAYTFAANDTAKKEDNHHIRKWTTFAEDTLALHHKLIKKHRHKMKKSTGGYAGNKDFYIEENYISHKTGKLLSKVQWEKKNPDIMHTIEVYVHDDNNRITRDFLAAYLPGYHNAPVQTLISFHQYSGKLHGFRSFDASGDKVLERCEGEYKGKPFEFIMDEDDLHAVSMDSNPIEEKVYALCVGNLPKKLGKYIKPQ